jgi:integrase
MGRPRLELGTYGEIHTKELDGNRWQARARYRDRDGVTREVAAQGDTPAKAKAALRKKLRDRRRGPAGAGDEITPESTVEDLLKHWLKICRADTDLALVNGARPRKGHDTLDGYEDNIDRVILPALRAVTMRELTTQRADRFLRDCEPISAGRTARTVLSQACKLAIAYGALEYSPVAAAYTPPRSAVRPRALTPDDAVEMRRRILAWQFGTSKLGPQRGYDRLRIFDVLLATGARIGEVLALIWADIIGLDGDGPVTVYIGHRLDKKGQRVPGRKSGGDPYTITLPDFGAAALREQLALGIPFAPVFPTRNGTFQSEANLRTHWRDIRGDDLQWVVPHSVRKTVITAVERELGLDAAARQAGHGSSNVTRKHYVERATVVPDYTAALDPFSRSFRGPEAVSDDEAG